MPGEIITTLVEHNRESLLKRLPSYMSPEQFFQLLRALDHDEKIAGVARRNPDSVLSAIFKAADCGLTIGNAMGHAYLIPFANEVVFVVGWRGLVYQWIRSGAALKVSAQVVYEGDQIEVIGGDEERIIHKPSLTDPHRGDPKWVNDPKNILGAYSIAWLPQAPLKAYRWVSRGMIEAARLRSSNSNGPAWQHNYAAMATKTAIRRLDGALQVCGPTKENREAWERYARTVELERESYREQDEVPDDYPGTAHTGRSGPQTGAAVVPSAISQPLSKSPARGKRLVAAPSPPPLTPEPEPPDEAVEGSETTVITDEKQDELIAQAGLIGMVPSKLKHYVAQKFNVSDLNQLTIDQAQQLTLELKAQVNK